ncbi:YveK family protein [Macrococcus equipercicus]|uniref:Capsular biosynthesis protein n=1 Tax=Macrococcus equipercicus TaxID=69967 RepID=A0A9Q9F372_9STAP|nr:Wzz/FepE/Etk N-terminal domain-containing protein [Macrococcus equipercicus]UTH13604.1 capsular biosynthesis protein [Macrococcus equipercicus]
MEEVIDLKEVLHILKRNLKWIIGLAVTLALLAFLYSAFLKTPIYQSESQVIINQKGKDTNVYNPGEVQTNLQLINTYSQMVNSKVVRQKVVDNLKIDAKEEDLADRITVTSEADSQLMKINVSGPHTKQNARIANELATVTQKEVKRVMGVDNLSVFSKADTNEKQSPVKPKPLQNAVIAGLLGAILGTAIGFLKKLLDNRMNTEEKIEQYLGLPTLGKIYKIEG